MTYGHSKYANKKYSKASVSQPAITTPRPLTVHCIVHETKPNGSKSLQTKAEQGLWKEGQLRPSQRTQLRPLSANNRDGVTIFSQ